MGPVFVRGTYVAGAVVDILAGIQLLVPEHVGMVVFEGMRPQGVAGLTAITAAVLMFGFAAILIWAQFRSIERRVVLLITLTVIVSLATVNIVLGVKGLQSWRILIPSLCIQAVLSTLFTTSYLIAVRAARLRSDD